MNSNNWCLCFSALVSWIHMMDVIVGESVTWRMTLDCIAASISVTAENSKRQRVWPNYTPTSWNIGSVAEASECCMHSLAAIEQDELHVCFVHFNSTIQFKNDLDRIEDDCCQTKAGCRQYLGSFYRKFQWQFAFRSYRKSLTMTARVGAGRFPGRNLNIIKLNV